MNKGIPRIIVLMEPRFVRRGTRSMRPEYSLYLNSRQPALQDENFDYYEPIHSGSAPRHPARVGGT